MFKEPSWVGPFRKFIGLEVRLLEIIPTRDGNNRFEYGIMSPNGQIICEVASYGDATSIGKSNGPWCSWSPD